MPAIAIVAVVLAIAAVPAYRAWARSQALARCNALQQQRALLPQGADINTINTLDAQIRLCADELRSLGLPVAPGLATGLDECATKARQIAAEWTHYRSTSYSDPMKRDNTRGAILRMGDEMVSCFSRSIEAATTFAEITAIDDLIRREIAASHGRLQCYLNDQSGCGRFGVSEEHGNDKARHERTRIYDPLLRVQEQAATKRRALRPAVAAAEETKAAGIAARNADEAASLIRRAMGAR